MANAPERDSVLPYFFAGLWGLAGVIMLAMGSHPPAQGILATGGQLLLFHAAAVMAVANQRAFGGIYKRAALALLLVGPAMFAAEIAIHASTGTQVPLLAPIGGGATILGWLCVAIGAIRTQKT
ncbi:DUF423 domain-containing protein [Asticcacaulis sp. AC402]|uniref:DUF423 domain-containing protein n=1 Tax=Asticcacaulis sp. AC402 TaxID=1282361 RepID=UPI0003C3C77C|nr:DUF423 domain-containing protein [Asticcacaulis sp. AC402]ESQ76038.1 hypothetical protein ABAC402_06220 [Asticcacaulis sp. AC402]